ncbi:mechanosensitive ion channel family protein [Pacificimonas sp. WHA3]|uniref:Mechanosensitive ion channel family protein n=1 Tax=Pacificimonas pallii TaxID=2827236 RepID=A0ABS6SDX6_9SPHN|nr:mechanosensitive ion channel family protein [Pacificimonas pallii]
MQDSAQDGAQGAAENVQDAVTQPAARVIDYADQVLDWVRNDSADVLIYCAAAFVLYLTLVLIREGFKKLAGDPERHGVYSWKGIFGRLVRRTRSFFLLACAAEAVILTVDAPAGFQRVVGFFFTVAAVIQGAIWIREFILAVIARKANDPNEDESTLQTAMGIIRLLVSIVVWALAVILILDNIGVDITALVAGLGVGGIAIGLAAQGIFSDLFAALSIIFDEPFKKGDVINYGAITGTVENIGLKTTRVRALDGEEVIVSNTKLLDDNIRNLAQFRRRRVVLHFGVTYQTPPKVLNSLQGELEALVSDIHGATFDRLHAFQFGSSSIDCELVFYSESADYGEMMQRRHDVMLALMTRFAEMDVDFAYPTQVEFIAGPDGKPIDPRIVRDEDKTGTD